jgi:hypothetical protein
MTAYESQSQPNGYNHNDQDDDDNNDSQMIHVDGNGNDQASSDNEQGLSRHGFDSSEEVLLELQSRYFLYFTDVSLKARYNWLARARANLWPSSRRHGISAQGEPNPYLTLVHPTGAQRTRSR